jgi:hypothetical protein
MNPVTVYRVRTPRAGRRTVLNTDTNRSAGFDIDYADEISATATVKMGAALLGDDLSDCDLWYGGDLQNRYGNRTATFIVAVLRPVSPQDRA